ncbi:TPA: peptidase S74, partial [Streptococcus pneumoniae]
MGMSCFFNREGKMEIRDLTESNITINADSYFLHGLTKSEIEYQISGITCKTDKKSLTVGMKTGRSLELDNVFMTQSALNDLYYKLKNLTYYPYNLNYQGHLLLEVGQWVTIQTNKKETFKVPVLSQSFTFKGGLRGRISADSKAGNDTQYSYEGTITKHIKQQGGIEAKIQAQIEATDKDFDQKVDKIKKDFNDQVELAKARAEEVKRELSDTINQRFNSFDNGPLKETKRKAEEALRNAGASSLLAQEAKRIGLDSVARLEAFKSQTTSAQTALSGDLDVLKRTIANDIRPKQAQAEAEIAKQVEALSRTKNELAGASTLLAQEAKRIELDSVARLEAFKSQTTSAQTALSGDLDALKRTIANDIRQKQAQAETEIAKQVEALSRTKNELAGVKSAQATYEETTTRRLSELTNLANSKASKSELTQTAEELASKIASVHLGRRNLLKGTKELARYKPVSEYNGFKVIRTVAGATRYQDSYVERTVIPTAGTEYIAIFYARASENDYPVRCHFYNPNTVVSSENSSGYKSRSSDGLSIIRLSTDWQLCWVKWTQTATDQAKTVIIGRHGPQVGGKEGVWVEICAPAIFEGNLAGDWSPAYEDQDERVSAVESNFKQRADSLEAGVSRLTEGLRTKADISSLNVTAENIRQSVKSLETDTQNKLNQKLSQAEFEVRAGSIRQEILNATKDKASKSELTQTAEELSSKIASVQVGGRNYIRGTKRMMLARGLWASGTFRPSGAGTAKTIDVSDSPATGFDKAIRLTSSNARDQIGIAQDGFYISQGTYTMSCWVKGRRGQKVKLQTYWQVNDNSGISPIFTLKDENWTKLSFTSARNRAGVASIGYVYLVNAEVGEYLDVLAPQLEDGSLATSSKEAPEDIEGQISTVESTFKQRANSLEAGVSRLTEGLRTKADISSLNVTAENIRQSVKSLETDTQNKLNQKLSQAEFEVRAGSIHQEILNATKDKASKSELTQTAEELASRIASVQASGRNLFLNSLFKQDISKTGIWTTSTYTAAIDSESKYLGHKALKIIGLNPSGRDGGNPKVTYPALGQFGKVIPGSTTNQDVTISFYAKANKNGIMLRSRLGNIGYKTGNVTLSTEIKRYVVHIPKGWTNESKQTTNEWLFNFNQEGTVWIWMPKFEISDVDTSYSEAPEDIEGQISTVESTFKQRANSLEAGVSRLTEGLRTKADISSLNVTAENIRQSVKSLETDTQNKLNQKLSQAEFEVRAGSIRQEILNATKDKADKTLVVSEAGKLREEFSKMKVGG